MGLEPGTRLGPYEILVPLGAGGMGEVYRARDTKLDRDVAVKVLPDAVASNAEALARFQREAKAVAALSHPNILAIHDLGEHEGRQYAVMELLHGETLRERIAGGPLTARKAAELARQIARGLAAAHERGIVHRDLKPENLFVTNEGRVKILDFGLARVERGRSEVDATRTSVTTPGMVMGTVGYMSPEQASGGVADSRSDIFSLGAILYEMLSGRRAFARETGAETMTAILREDPPALGGSVRDVPPALERVVQRCLEKRPEERFQSANDLGFAVANAAETSTSYPPATADTVARRRSFPRAAVAFALVLGVGILAGWALHAVLRAPARSAAVRVRTLTFSGRDRSPAASPDGKTIAFTSARDGVPRIWLKQLDGGEAALTEGPDDHPRFSPDGASIAFVRDDETGRSAFRVPVVGGQPRRLLDDVSEVDWSPDGKTLAFLRAHDMGVVVGVADPGTGEERELAAVEGRALFALSWSPDGRKLTVSEALLAGNVADSAILLIDAASGELERVRPSGQMPISGAAWMPGGRGLIVAQSESLLGSVANPSNRVLRIDPRDGSEQVLFWADNLFTNLASHFTRFAIATPDRIVFNEIDVRQNLQETEVSAGRGADARPLTNGSSRDRQPVYSPDGKTILFSSNRSGQLDLWALDVATGAVTQLTDDAAADWDPAFTPDGRSILWSSDRGGNLEIWSADADGGHATQVSHDGLDAENPGATPDGRWIVYASGGEEKKGIWRVRPDGSEPGRLVEGVYMIPEVSPDGRWAAYLVPGSENLSTLIRVVGIESGEIAPFEIDVRQDTTTSNVVLGRLRFMPDGRSLAYLAQNEDGASGVVVQDFVPGKDATPSRRPLAGFSPDFSIESFGISPDGRHIVLSTMIETQSLMLAEL